VAHSVQPPVRVKTNPKLSHHLRDLWRSHFLYVRDAKNARKTDISVRNCIPRRALKRTASAASLRASTHSVPSGVWRRHATRKHRGTRPTRDDLAMTVRQPSKSSSTYTRHPFSLGAARILAGEHGCWCCRRLFYKKTTPYVRPYADMLEAPPIAGHILDVAHLVHGETKVESREQQER